MSHPKKMKLLLIIASLAALVLSASLGTASLAFSTAQAAPIYQIGDTETPTPTSTSSPTLEPTFTATATQPPTSFERPIIVIKTYNTSPSPVTPGQDFDLKIQLANAGQITARNVVVSFAPGDFLARSTGGVVAIPEVTSGSQRDFTQPMTASFSLWGYPVATLDATINYSDSSGNPYSENFTLSIFLTPPKGAAPTATATTTPTATPTSSTVERPQLVITNYETDTVPLQPGSSFNLTLQVENLGNSLARRVTMIVGGGSTISNGTPGPGGISGASGEFTNFAPLGTSNIQSLGDIAGGTVIRASQPLIVNVSTNPGAYPMKISFAYLTETGVALVDEQVITLLVYTLPSVEISFYRDPGLLLMSQPNFLPIQINNLGRKSSVFGNLRVSAPSGTLENNVILIGPLEAGGYYTLDATFIPDAPGTFELTVTVDYTDDFNMSRQIVRTLTVEVQEFIPPEEPMIPEGENGGFPPESTPETFWQKVWRFILGLLGLDSGKPQPTIEEVIPEGQPAEGEVIPIGPPLKGP
jgi:hypothetical protein